MKLFSEHPGAHVSMGDIPRLVEILRNLPHSHIVETGTHRGEGSTRMLASLNPERLISIEANRENFEYAKALYDGKDNIEILHGLSVGMQEAVGFMAQDEAISKHEKYPDVFIDDIENPLGFYGREIKDAPEENLLRKALKEVKHFSPVILLDSAGGLGFLEYQIVLKEMEGLPFTLVLDDTHHLKHFRSREDVLFGDRHPAVLYDYNGVMVAYFAAIFDIRIVTGALGDILQVYDVASKQDCQVIVVSKKYFNQAKELFFEKSDLRIIGFDIENTHHPYEAFAIAKHRWPYNNIVICQQNGTGEERVKQLSSYEAYQKHHAGL